MELMPHIKIPDSNQIKYGLLPGDPGRLDRVATYLEEVEEIAYNREFRSLKGTYKGIQVLVVSTGIGGASTGIVVEELAKIGVCNMIRIGSCGALQKHIKLGDLILVNAVVRDEGTSKAYIDAIYPAVSDYNLLNACVQSAEKLNASHYVGLARSHDSFYTEQEEKIDAYWSEKGILGADMETAALFTIGALRKVRTASILNNVVEYEANLQEQINLYTNGESKVALGEANEILTALEAFVIIDATK